MRLRHLLAFLTLALALGAAHANSAAPAPAHPVQSEYDLGVEAFRAEDYVQARRHWQSCALEADAPPEAFNNLGYLLHEGLGGAADPEGGVAL